MHVCLMYRPVDCYTHETLVFTPGFVNTTIYNDQVETGWNFGPYFVHSADFWRQGGTITTFCCTAIMLRSSCEAECVYTLLGKRL